MALSNSRIIGVNEEDDAHFKEMMAHAAETILWRDILREAKTNPGLAELLDKVEAFYFLGKE